MKKVSWIIVLFTVVAFASSCKNEGCTDRSAVNYDSDATKDDGSCCIRTETDTSISYAIYDNDPGSPHYQELAGAITVKRKVFKYSGSSCSDLGYGEDRCENVVIIISNQADNISFTYSVEFGPGNAWVEAGTANLSSYDEQETIVDTSCEEYDIGTTTFDVGPVIYN